MTEKEFNELCIDDGILFIGNDIIMLRQIDDYHNGTLYSQYTHSSTNHINLIDKLKWDGEFVGINDDAFHRVPKLEIDKTIKKYNLQHYDKVTLE